MKFIHTADLHIYDKHKYSLDGSRLRIMEKNLRLMVKYAVKNKIKVIIIAGDIFHVSNPSEKLLKVLTKFVEIAILRGVSIRLLTGNHDTDGVNYSFESLSNIANIYTNVDKRNSKKIITLRVLPLVPGKESIYSEIIENTNFVYVPWQENLSDVIIKSRKFKIKDKFNVLTTHGVVDKVSTNSGYLVKNKKLTTKTLSGWDYVALGDFHKNQGLGNNVYYSGSMVKTVWDERLSKRMFNVVTLDSLAGVSVKRVKIPDTEFIELKLNYSQIDKYLLDEISEINGVKILGSYIKLFITETTGYGEKIFKLKKILLGAGAADVFLKIVKKLDDGIVKLDEDSANINLDIGDVCKSFLKKQTFDNKSEYIEYIKNKIMEL